MFYYTSKFNFLKLCNFNKILYFKSEVSKNKCEKLKKKTYGWGDFWAALEVPCCSDVISMWNPPGTKQ